MINKLINVKENINIKLLVIITKGKGKITTISTSKIKKTIPTKKNFKENGTRESEKGSNPHSKGEFFLWLFSLERPKKKINLLIKRLLLKWQYINKKLFNFFRNYLIGN